MSGRVFVCEGMNLAFLCVFSIVFQVFRQSCIFVFLPPPFFFLYLNQITYFKTDNLSICKDTIRPLDFKSHILYIDTCTYYHRAYFHKGITY